MREPSLGRLGALLIVFAIGLVAVTVRLGYLQVVDRGRYESKAMQQRVRTVPLPAVRGAILDRNERDLALSLDAKAIYADQRFIPDPMAAAVRMSGPLGIKPMELAQTLKGEASFVYVARQVDREVAEQIAAMNIPGIGFLEESKRHYPAGDMGAPQVIGFVGIDGQGLAGLELQYEGILAGTPGERQEEIDPAGHQIPQGIQVVTPPMPGQDIISTIDAPLQYRAQLALAETVKRERADGGTLIAMDPETGDILAMASDPWFDPNELDRAKEVELSNPAVQALFEPGSVNKVITAAAAVEEHAVGLTEKFRVYDSISKDFGDGNPITVHDSHPHAPETMTLGDIITESSNVGTIMIGGELGEDEMATYLSKFGFGRDTGIDFPYESGGILPEPYQWSGATMLNIPIGQGVSVTPLQMASVYATVANDGVWVQPRLVRATRDADGTVHPMPGSPTRRVISKETADIVTGMLANVVSSSRGTGTEAAIEGYWVAGKTGTAQKPREDGGGYSHRYMASFIGFLPADDPQIVIAVILDEPAQQYGGLAAAPLFQQFGKEAIARLRIPAGGRPDLPPTAQR